MAGKRIRKNAAIEVRVIMNRETPKKRKFWRLAKISDKKDKFWSLVKIKGQKRLFKNAFMLLENNKLNRQRRFSL